MVDVTSPTTPLVFSCITVFITLMCIVFDPHFNLPFGDKRRVAVPWYMFPLFCVILLWMMGTFNHKTIENGVLGDDDVNPLGVICIFLSLAYMCMALDKTDFFYLVSDKMLKAAGSSGRLLFFYAFLLTVILTVFTDNDVVVLTLTPILFYFTSATDSLRPLPFVMSEFFAANVAGAARLIGNPATIIVSQAQGLNFLTYMQWMLLPTVVALVVLYGTMYCMFYKQIPKNINSATQQQGAKINVVYCGCVSLSERNHADFGAEDEILVSDIDLSKTHNPTTLKELADPQGAIVIAAALFLVMVALSVCHIFHIELWQVCLAFAVFVFVYCSWAYEIRPLIFGTRLMRAMTPSEKKKSQNSTSKKDQSTPLCEGRVRLRLHDGVLAMPWEVIPFVLGMFILVEGLNEYGWIDRVGAEFVKVIGTEYGGLYDTLPLTYAVLGVTVVVTNFMNNQPAAILFSRIILSSAFVQGTTYRQQLGSGFAVIIATNFGANYTLIGALAGVIWINILRAKNVPCTPLKFTGVGSTVVILPTLVAMFVINLEINAWAPLVKP